MKCEIEIENIPKGWRVVAIRTPINGADHIAISNHVVVRAKGDWTQPMPILEKIQPRRIILEETAEDNRKFESGCYETQTFAKVSLYGQPKIWREVKEDAEAANRDQES